MNIESENKLIVASPHHGYGIESRSGGGVYERELLQKLGNENLKIHTLLNKDSGYITCPNVHVTKIKTPTLYRFSSTFAFLWGLNNLWRKEKFNFIRAHNLRSIIASSWAFRGLVSPIPFVVHIYHVEETEKRFFGIPTSYMLKDAAGIVTISEYSADKIASEYSFDREKICNASLGIDTTRYKPISAKNTRWHVLVDHSPLLLFVGGIIPRKNLFFLCDVISKLAETYPSIGLAIAGDGTQKAELINYIKQKTLSDRIHLLGSIEEEEKVALYNLCDVFVFPSLVEGFGMAPAEAMACERPVVVADSTSLVEVVKNGKTGLWANPRNVLDFSQKTQWVLENPSRSREMGTAGRHWVEKQFSWERTAKIVREFYLRSATIQ